VPLPLANPQANNDSALCTRDNRRVFEAPAWLRLWHLTSLDAPTVAVTWSFAFAWAASVHLPAWVPLLIALATWAVYVGDRLLDARGALRSGDLSDLRERHFFHWRNRRVLIAFAATAASVAAALIVQRMPVTMRERDSALAVAALAYFSGVHSGSRSPAWLRNLLSKEFLVGFLFTAGCALPTLSRMRPGAPPTAPPGLLLVTVIFFASLAWLNCHAIQRWESSGASRVFSFACVLAFVGILLASVLALVQPHLTAMLVAGAASALLLALLDRLRNRLTPLALRASADLALLTPLLLISFAVHVR
jgi:hypothetical protein